MIAELGEKYIQREEYVTSQMTRLEESRALYEDIREEKDQLRITHADLIKERNDAQRVASDLRARVIEL